MSVHIGYTYSILFRNPPTLVSQPPHQKANWMWGYNARSGAWDKRYRTASTTSDINVCSSSGGSSSSLLKTRLKESESLSILLRFPNHATNVTWPMSDKWRQTKICSVVKHTWTRKPVLMIWTGSTTSRRWWRNTRTQTNQVRLTLKSSHLLFRNGNLLNPLKMQ